MNNMTDRKPYLLRATYEWILDNNCTPHLLVVAPGAGWVRGVPEHLLKEDYLVLNISPTATHNLVINNDAIVFDTRFSGQSHHVWIAIEAVASLVTRENGEGFEEFPVLSELKEGPQEKPIVKPNKKSGKGKSGGSHLRIIK